MCARPGSGLWAVDKSPSYLDDPSAAAKVHRIAPSAKILAVLCDPAERHWKEYFHMLRYNPKFIPSCAERTANVSHARQMYDKLASERLSSFGPPFMDFYASDLARGLYGRHLQAWVSTLAARDLDASMAYVAHQTWLVCVNIRWGHKARAGCMSMVMEVQV